MKKALIIEDNENNLYLISFMLKQNGYEVISANSGEKGVEKAATGEADFILMDIQLPDIDGLEATRRIRAIPRAREIPIIAITSYAMAGDEQKALDAGCTGYLRKPIDPDSFINDMERYLGGKHE